MDKIFDLKKIIINTLDSNKALDIVSIDLENKSSIADYLILLVELHQDICKHYLRWF